MALPELAALAKRGHLCILRTALLRMPGISKSARLELRLPHTWQQHQASWLHLEHPCSTVATVAVVAVVVAAVAVSGAGAHAGRV